MAQMVVAVGTLHGGARTQPAEVHTEARVVFNRFQCYCSIK